MLIVAPRHAAAPARGFSLIEMMISLVVGLILIGSVVALLASNIQANAQNIASTRLTQELRAVMEVVTGELRRARYQRAADQLMSAGSPAPANRKNNQPVTVIDHVGATNDADACPGTCLPGQVSTTDGDCIRFAYEDAPLIVAGDANDECRAISLGTVNGINAAFIAGSVKDKATPAACGALPACGAGVRLTSPAVNLTHLSFNFDSANDTIVITVEGNLVSDSTVTRRYTEMVRLASPAVP
jgi:prepilin-type N-terminal cleavage/methylation domain-containing protein